jgi:peptidoglycan/xylan/chitin deacetylase (PgdA/CDA1 family)
MLFMLLAVFGLSACAGAPAAATPNLEMTRVFAEALQAATRSLPTATVSPTPTLPPSATPSPSATPTPIRTPPVLPTTFNSSILTSGAVPQTYIKNTCQYLKDRWNPNNSVPGTVVMTIMYHSVTEDFNTLASDGSQVHHSDLVMALEHAHEVGFQTITVDQLADFLENNTRIPPRSLLIIVDDRKRKEYYEEHFVPYLRKFNWTITNAWISAPDTPEYLWQENREIQAAGWVDAQAHGVIHNIPAGEYSSDDFLRKELQGSIDAIREKFGTTPIGYIWPGGGFTRRSVELAREAGYRVGFTTNPRGPVMFNWVPLASQVDPAHTYWLPETEVNDPLMVLPRYWSIDAAYRIDDVIAIGDQAAEAAAQSKTTELDYYDIVCKPLLGEIATPAP